MKPSFSLLFIGLVASMTYGRNGLAQDLLKRPVTVEAKQRDLKAVLNHIEKSARVRFAYSPSLVRGRKVDLVLYNQPLGEVLSLLLRPYRIQYTVSGDYIILSRDPTPSGSGQSSHTSSSTDWASADIEVPADRVISGSVTDERGLGLPGVNIIIKGTNRGTTANADGNFRLNVPEGNTLVFSLVGYITREARIDRRSTVDLRLQTDNKTLEEVVVVGYGAQQKSDVTGAIISVSEKELKSRPVNNALEAIQGKAAGVDITSNERPGEIGQIRIRGLRSLTASNVPLYVVDGIPLMSSAGIETLNPQDIESVDVLKDASATAVYGSRGANGVVLVTTKKGEAGRMTMSYSGTATVENIRDFTRMMDAGEYLTWRRWAYYYADPNKYPRGDQPTEANDYIIFLGANDPYAWANIMKGWEGGTWDGSKVATTDWFGMVTRTALTQTHTITLSGGSDKIKAFGSFGYLKNEGTMKGQGFTRYSSKVSVDLAPYKWFEMGVSVNASYSIQDFGQSNTGGPTSGPNTIYRAARSLFPYAVPYDADGNRIQFPGGDDIVKNVADEWLYSVDTRYQLRALGNFYAQVNILPGLKYRMNFGPDFRYFRNGVYIDAQSFNRMGAPNMASLENQNDFSWTLDNLIYYDKAIGRHKFGLTLLQTASSWTQNGSYMRALGIPLPSQKWNALNLSNIAALDSWDSNLTERQLMSYMARVNYSLSRKYLLTVSGRLDGASQLAKGHKWAFFSSAALAWRMSEEAFLKDVSWIGQLKMRLGLGTTGNSAISPYQTKGGVVSLFYPYGTTITQGYTPSEYQIAGGNLAMDNQALTWEKTTQYNLGIDFSVLEGRVSGVVDLYTSHTTDLLMEMSIPPLNGFTRTFANIGETKNKGIDLTLNTENIKAGGFMWETGLNTAWQKDIIISLANGKEDDIANSWFIGHSIGTLYGYEPNGLWHESDAEEMAKFNANGHRFQVGMARPVDQNGDYKINPNDDRVMIGHTNPRWTLGMTNSFSYKNFSLSVFMYGRLGYTYDTGGEWQGGRYTQRSISYYNENNKDAQYQKPIYNVAGGDPYFNVLGYRSGAFLKVRTIHLGYSFPVSITEKLKLSHLKVYIQGKNPGMLFSGIKWIDPDLGTSSWNRGLSMGLDIQF